MRRPVCLLLALVVLSFATAASAQNLLANVSSGDGDFNGWLASVPTSFASICNAVGCAGGNSALNFAPNAGVQMSGDAAPGPAEDNLTSFYLSDPAGTAKNYVSVTFDSASVNLANFGASLGWQDYEVSGYSSENQLLATMHDNRGFGLNNIVVATDQGSVPEPGSIVLFATGALALAGAARRKLSI